MNKTYTELRFVQRPKKSTSPHGWPIRTWESRNGLYRVAAATITGYVTVYRATRLVWVTIAGEQREQWTSVSNHRKLATAIKSCRTDWKEQNK